MEHNFNLSIAKKFGVEEAIIIHNIYFWTLKNKANGKHFHDGNYWTYNSIEAFTELFPYWSRRQIERILKNAVEKGAIIKGNYNKIAYDRTTWYALTETVKSIYANGEMETTEWGNGSTQSGETIPDSKPDSKPFDKPDDINKEEEKKELDFLAFRKTSFFETLINYFGKTKEAQQMPMSSFLNNLFINDKLEEFKAQTLAYIEYKSIKEEASHKWETYQTEWEKTDYVHLLKQIKTKPKTTIKRALI